MSWALSVPWELRKQRSSVCSHGQGHSSWMCRGTVRASPLSLSVPISPSHHPSPQTPRTPGKLTGISRWKEDLKTWLVESVSVFPSEPGPYKTLTWPNKPWRGSGHFFPLKMHRSMKESALASPQRWDCIKITDEWNLLILKGLCIWKWFSETSDTRYQDRHLRSCQVPRYFFFYSNNKNSFFWFKFLRIRAWNWCL